MFAKAKNTPEISLWLKMIGADVIFLGGGRLETLCTGGSVDDGLGFYLKFINFCNQGRA